MDFKERFKGRTSTLTKEGVIENLSGALNPVLKSYSNPPLPTSSSNSTPMAINNPQMHPPSASRFSYKNTENRPIMPTHVSHSVSRSPENHFNINQGNPTRIPSGNNSASKNPYLVNNPFPSLDSQGNQYPNYSTGYNSNARLPPPDYMNAQQNAPNNQFNPNSFYNQHSQYKGDTTPKREYFENQPNYAMNNTNQMHKKNFENLTQQNKQKRMAEEALRGFENQVSPPRANNRYGNQEPPQLAPSYSNPGTSYNRPPPSMPGYGGNTGYNNGYNGYNGYNGSRDIHSNPAPQQQFEGNGFGYVPGNMTYQGERGRSYEDQFAYANNPQSIKNGSNNKTGYKPYSLKDFKDLKTRLPVQLGGLGPNTNTGEWQKEKDKRDKMIEFSQNVKMFNSQRIGGTENNFKPRKDKDKERSKRDVALEFARNIPKPKPRKNSPINENEEEDDEEILDMHARKAESDIGFYGRRNNDDLDEFERRHMQYQAQLERMKMK